VKRSNAGSFAFCLLILIAAPSAIYGQFSYPNFSSTTGLQLVGSATVVSNAIQLTVASTGAAASAFWYTTPVNVGPGFSTTFTYSISPGGADGLAFVIQNDPNGSSAIGSNGYRLAASGIANGVAIAFRTYVFKTSRSIPAEWEMRYRSAGVLSHPSPNPDLAARTRF